MALSHEGLPEVMASVDLGDRKEFSVFEVVLLVPGIQKSQKLFLKTNPFGDLLYIVTFKVIFFQLLFTAVKNQL